MYFLYSFLLGAWIIFMLPFFLINGIRKKKYLPALRERMGRLPKSLDADGRTTIWFHACSVGEMLSLQPLASMLHERFPDARLVFSAITSGGRRIAEERFGKYGPGNAFYFPIDEPVFIGRVLDRIRPDMLIVVDTEIWPNTLKMCHNRDVPIVLVNGRISAESFQYYRWIAPLMAPVFRNYSALLMKAEEDAGRIRKLGAPAGKVRVSGNIKYDRDIVEKEVSEATRAALAAAFGLNSPSASEGAGGRIAPSASDKLRPGSGAAPLGEAGRGSPASGTRIIVAGSTHEGEEEILFTVMRRLRDQAETADVRLMIAPRHPERFPHVAALAQKHGFTVSRRSVGRPENGAEILLIDTLGELAAAYQFADVAFVGGTLIPHGGQSIMEPALYGKPIVIGRSMENFPDTIDDFLDAEALWQLAASHEDRAAQTEQLALAFTTLLSSPDRCAVMGSRALSLFEKSRGATALTADVVATLLEPRMRPAPAPEPVVTV